MKNNMVTCCFPIEIKSRELDARLLLACELAKNGFKCFLGSKKIVHNMMPEFVPFLYFDKGLTPEQLDFCKNVHKMGSFVVSLDEEGGVIEKGMFTFLIRFPEKIMPFLDIIFLWGEE